MNVPFSFYSLCHLIGFFGELETWNSHYVRGWVGVLYISLMLSRSYGLRLGFLVESRQALNTYMFFIGWLLRLCGDVCEYDILA
jgi:hypothetical protein